MPKLLSALAIAALMVAVAPSANAAPAAGFLQSLKSGQRLVEKTAGMVIIATVIIIAGGGMATALPLVVVIAKALAAG